MSKIDRLCKDNEQIMNRYNRAAKSGDIREMYAARADYETNISKQQYEMRMLDKSSPKYQAAKDSLDQQITNKHSMSAIIAHGKEPYETKALMENYEKSNNQLVYQMGEAIDRGDYSKYGLLRSEYCKNMKAQEGISSELTTDQMSHSQSVLTQESNLRNLDIDMRNQLQQQISQSRRPDPRVVSAYEDCCQKVKTGEQEALEKIDRKKMEAAEAQFKDKDLSRYGLSEDALQREQEHLDASRDRLLGNDRGK